MAHWEYLKYRINWALSFHPAVFIPLYRLLAPPLRPTLLVGPDTEIVLEGYPRSANTFALVAFGVSQGRRVNIAHHLHLPVQIIEGVRRSLPVLVLIRNPLQAIRSFQVRNPELGRRWPFQQYLSFYRLVERLSDRVVLAEFDEVSRDFGPVIRRLNDKFGVHFRLFEHTEVNVKNVFRRIDALNQDLDGGKETHVARPNASRLELYEKMALEVEPELKNQVLEIFQRLTGKSGSEE